MSLDTAPANLLAAAKLWLTSPPAPGGTPTGDMPYLSVALYALVAVPTDRVLRMTTDPAWRLYVNPAWLEDPGRTASEVGRELAHQVWHLLADHAGRATDMGVTAVTAGHWRVATDATVHDVVHTLPGAAPGSELLTTASRRLPSGLAAEQYFAMLSRLPAAPPDAGDQHLPGARPPTLRAARDESPDGSCGSGCDGLLRPYELADLAESGGLNAVAAHAIRTSVAVEFQQTRGRGDLPGEWGRWVEQILDPVVDWRNVLHAAVRRGLGWANGHSDYTYTRISRRQAAAGAVILPALRRPVPRVAVVVDTSGSVDDGLLAQALGEIDGVLAALGVADPQVTVMAVDAALHTVATVRSAAAVTLAGGGGTDMAVGIAAAQDLRPRVDVIVVLTDGETGWPRAAPAVPVIGVLIGRTRQHLPRTPDWIQRVECVR